MFNRLFKKKTSIVKVEKFIEKENSKERKERIIKTTTNVNKFFNTIKNLKLIKEDKTKYERDFIDRCFSSIDFKSEIELKDLYIKLKLYINEMELETVEYCDKLFNYCKKTYMK